MWVELTVTDKFDAAHHLPGMGKCSNVHGHTYKVAVTVYAKVDKDGIGVGFATLKDIMRRWITARLDHKDLNDVLPYMTTAENIARWILETYTEAMRLKRIKASMQSVSVWETASCCATYRGDR